MLYREQFITQFPVICYVEISIADVRASGTDHVQRSTLSMRGRKKMRKESNMSVTESESSYMYTMQI